MATWNIYSQPHGKIVTCQRPIVIVMRVSAGAVAHFVGKLYRKDGASFVDTNVRINAFGDSSSAYFELNAAEYCRNYFTEEAAYYQGQFCNNFDEMVEQTFKLEIYPVLYDNSLDLVPDPDDILETNEFIVIPTNTMAREATSSLGDNIRLDKFVFNGDNDSAAPQQGNQNYRFLSNMPNYNVMDISQGFYFHHNHLHQQVSGITGQLDITNSSGVTFDIPTNYPTGYVAIPAHPFAWETLIAFIYGPQNLFFDALGNLTSDSMSFQWKYIDSGGTVVRETPIQTYLLKDGMGCKSTTFIFRNMRGGFDFFTATGEHDVSVELSGSEFDRHTDFNRRAADFDLKRGQHNMTNLWNKRKEMNTVFTQPVNTETATWLEELIVSPQVWIIKDIKGNFTTGDNLNMPYNNKGLVAINIIKSSYKLHNTEKNRNFIEFKYTLSENTITQKM